MVYNKNIVSFADVGHTTKLLISRIVADLSFHVLLCSFTYLTVFAEVSFALLLCFFMHLF